MEAMMGDTYDSAAEAEADRAQQKDLLTALNAWDRALRRDECGAWCIHGDKWLRAGGVKMINLSGSIHTWGDGKTWAVYVRCFSGKHWAYTKKRMSFCEVTQDGDDEGSFRLHQLPTSEQAEVVRDVVGIRQRREYSEETREILRARIASWNGAEPQQEAPLEGISRANATGPVPGTGESETPIFDAKSAK
jgi:hypothetical protein